jgi:hypothetical protein
MRFQIVGNEMRFLQRAILKAIPTILKANCIAIFEIVNPNGHFKYAASINIKLLINKCEE